jgi:3-methyladenine DNA glycosylase Tag
MVGTSREEMSMEAPKQIRPKRLNDYLEVMTKSAFQSGISWKVIEAKWPGFKEAFFDFDPVKVAELDPPDVDRLTEDTRIVRNRKKIEATVHNAQTMLELDREHGSFKKYLRSKDSFDETAADLRKRFKFLGDLGVYYFLYVVGEQVPAHEDWMAARGGTTSSRRPARRRR